MRSPVHPEDAGGARHGIQRSPAWPHAEKLHLQLQPTCVCCKPGMHPNAGVQVHHIFPFHYVIALGRPDLELDQRNLITLCENEEGKPGENHHLLVGHLDSFQSSNLSVVEHAEKTFFGNSAEQIRNSALWRADVAKRLKPLSQMTDKEKEAFAKLMNARFPKR